MCKVHTLRSNMSVADRNKVPSATLKNVWMVGAQTANATAVHAAPTHS